MKLAAFLALPLLASATIAQAQAYQCALPTTAPAVRKPVPDGPARTMPVTGYTLALSWSPEYCRGQGGRPGDAFQCGRQSGRFGLILHGLWPEGANGRWPQWCPTRRQASPQVLRQNMCMTPSAQLQAHEWAKHGSCMANTPETYFRVARILWDVNARRFPDLDLLSRRKDLNAGLIREAFVIANPAWQPRMIGVHLNERGWLEEIRLCYGKDFLPARCTKGQYGAADTAPAKVFKGL